MQRLVQVSGGLHPQSQGFLGQGDLRDDVLGPANRSRLLERGESLLILPLAAQRDAPLDCTVEIVGERRPHLSQRGFGDEHERQKDLHLALFPRGS